MKQTAAVLALLLLLVVSSQAQVGFGITGGVNFANVGGADVTNAPKSLTVFAGGVYLDLSVPFLISIQPEVLYSMKGYVIEPSSGAKSTFSLNYVEVPVLIKYSFPVPVLKPTLYVGPAMGVLLNAKKKVEMSGLPTQDTDIKDITRSTDWGFVFGASAHLAIITVSARYTMGLTTLDKSGSPKAYNRVWSIFLEIPMY